MDAKSTIPKNSEINNSFYWMAGAAAAVARGSAEKGKVRCAGRCSGLRFSITVKIV